MSESTPIIYYDGHCALCSGWVKSVLRLDDKGIFRFAPLQSSLANERLAAFDIDTENLDSVILETEDKVFLKSDVALEVMSMLGWPYRVLSVLKVFPLGFRNAVYDWVARNRYATFGKHDACWMPRKEWKGRFIGE